MRHAKPGRGTARRWAPIALGVIAVLAIGVTGCVNVLLPEVDTHFSGPAARPAALAAFGDDAAIVNPAVAISCCA